jgi:ribosomal protein S18 acetylase RimI-like enzyme
MTISIDPVAEATTIRRVDPREVDRLARVLAQAFYDDDPVFDWFFPTRRKRLHRMVQHFRLSLDRMTVPHGHVYTTEAVSGGALWVPPGKHELSRGESLRVAVETIRAYGRDSLRAFRGVSALEEHHPHEHHWYLMFLAVAPEWRGAGLGTALMQPVLERADADGMPAYVDATAPRNRRLYERHGFEVMREVVLPSNGPPMWQMWREPQ